MNCKLCGQELLEPGKGHHQETCPVDHTLCSGCFVFRVEYAMFLIRKVQRTVWTLEIEEDIAEILKMFRGPNRPARRQAPADPPSEIHQEP